MRRFQAAAERLGTTPPAGTSLKRMFAYWETGERAVTVAAYQRAFLEIYGATPEALGFVPPDDSTRLLEIRSARVDLIQADDGLVALLEAQTQSLRLVDRQLGSSVQAAVTEAHVHQIDQILHRCIGNHRARVGAALAGAAELAGWQALDRGDVDTAWSMHERAKDGARESGDRALLAHVTAQQSVVLLDAGQPRVAVELAHEGARLAGDKVAPVLQSWLAATEAEALAAVGEAAGARRRLAHAERVYSPEGAETLPFLMLTLAHLDRWRGHCLADLGDAAAVEALHGAQSAESDSVRAATGLRTDLALALLRLGRMEEAVAEASQAQSMAARFGSVRQRRRLRAVQTRIKGQVVQQADEGS
jgi:tetratricopeptide (TPR) repeat protein